MEKNPVTKTPEDGKTKGNKHRKKARQGGVVVCCLRPRPVQCTNCLCHISTTNTDGVTGG